MASRAADRSLADFIAGALNPPLIMALVGSLVFFLQEILYGGLYRGTLQWVLFFFVFGAVLIARMTMIGDLSSKSAAYGLVLGGLVWLALKQYVDYSENPTLAGRSGFINLGLIALIWWSAHRLTLDCTFLDEEAKGQGAGLLDAAGLDKTAKPAVEEKPAEEPKKTGKSKKKTPEEQPGLAGWFARFLSYRERKKKQPKTLGVWVIFFSLAALPLFGLGQAQIPASDVARRSYAFSLLLVYVGAGLGLLLTTSFLSLRMYLRERGVTMPVGITLSWLFLGALLICGHLFVSSLLPRPADPQPLWDWTGLTGAGGRDPARWSPMREGDDPKNRSLPEGKSGKPVPDEKAGDDAQDGQNGEQRSRTSKGRKGDKSDDADSGRKGDKEKGDRKAPGGKGDKETDGGNQQAENNPAQLPEVLAPVSSIMEPLLKIAKWIIIALVVLLVAIIVGRAALQFLANFTHWAASLLAFFERLGQKGDGKPPEASEETRPTPRPFATYSNPFDNGRAKEMSPAELVRYSFSALQAWGRERDLTRGEGETPMEFAERLGPRYPDLGEECRKLALQYARLAYSTETLSEVKINSLRNFWTMLCNVQDEGNKRKAKSNSN
jgi:hypothetical protein